jgi:DNA-binding response OmpR family regulator
MGTSISSAAEGGRVAPGIETTVLIVEEDPEFLRYYASVLRRKGYLVRTCGSYDEGMRVLQPGVYGLVVVGLGELPGGELADGL